MSQAVDYELGAALSGLAFRIELNDILDAIATGNVGNDAPATTYPNMVWIEADAARIWRRTNANDGWIDVGPLAAHFDAALEALDQLTPAADRVPYFDSTTTAALRVLGSQADINAGTAARIVEADKLAGRPAFMAHKNGTNQTGVTPATFVKITFTTEVFDTGAFYDAANSKWVPPAGKYFIGCSLLWQTNLVDQQEANAIIYKNGAEALLATFRHSGTGTLSTFVYGLVDADGNDEFEVYGYAGLGGSGDKTINGTSSRSFFFAKPL